MNFLLGPILKYITGGLLVALIGVSLALRVQSGRLAERTQERDAARTQAAQLLAATAGKDQTIDALKAAAEAWKGLSTPAEAMNQAADRVAHAADQIAARAAALSPAEVKDHANPDCSSLLALDIARACPGTAAGVRLRAQGGLQGSTSGSASAGGAETP